jgi:hypothetical protein
MVGITLIVAQGITGDIPTMAVAHQEMLRLRICFDEHSQFNAQLSSCLRPARCALKGAGIANLLELSGDSQQASGRRLLKLLKCGLILDEGIHVSIDEHGKRAKILHYSLTLIRVGFSNAYGAGNIKVLGTVMNHLSSEI